MSPAPPGRQLWTAGVGSAGGSAARSSWPAAACATAPASAGSRPPGNSSFSSQKILMTTPDHTTNQEEIASPHTKRPSPQRQSRQAPPRRAQTRERNALRGSHLIRHHRQTRRARTPEHPCTGSIGGRAIRDAGILKWLEVVRLSRPAHRLTVEHGCSAAVSMIYLNLTITLSHEYHDLCSHGMAKDNSFCRRVPAPGSIPFGPG